MFIKILVPLDGSAYAERALPVAEAIAANDGADLAIVRVVEVLPPGEREPGVVSYLDEGRIRSAQEYVANAAARLRLGRPIAAEALLAADVPSGILARVAELGADLIVLTSHGASWPAESVLGGVAAHLTRQAACPVLMIGPKAAATVTPLASPPEVSAGR
jgi:nucleotide-binding universal stress UspA family protein